MEKATIDNLIERILSIGPGYSREGLAYLYEAESIQEYRFLTQAGDADKRMDYLIKEIIRCGQPNLLDGDKYLILVASSPEYQLLMKELPAIGTIVEHLQDHGSVSFDFGIKEGLDKELEVLIVRSR